MIINRQQINTAIALFPFLKHQDEHFLKQFYDNTQFVNLKNDQLICDQNNACTHLALIISGTARVYKLGQNGREITLYRIGPGESCILTASCILSCKPFPAIAVSETPMEAILIPAEKVNTWLAESVPWRDYVFGLVATRLSDIISIVEEVAFKRMDKRIIEYLTVNAAPDSHDVTATHQQIAFDLGTSREVVSRILKDLKNANLIRISRGTIKVLDLPGLQEKIAD